MHDYGGNMTRRFPAAILSACLITASTAASADPPWARGEQGHHGGERGHGHMRDWRKGEYYSRWREQRWRVQDWRRYRGLWAPPSGCYWMQSGGQYLLVVAATGLIAGVVAATAGAVPAVPVAPAYPAPAYPAVPVYPGQPAYPPPY
ncbi:hypothetical protein SXCC_02616 [Gluconacetobacter sp. SXCC-1]|nr:hypothetical protein CT154_08485 [Komagataeibacter xylinus]EGG76691.1 hypothetical protein SXCC_02616 [Gluconacetobacter sp. SXCC-1]